MPRPKPHPFSADKSQLVVEKIMFVDFVSGKYYIPRMLVVIPGTISKRFNTSLASFQVVPDDKQATEQAPLDAALARDVATLYACEIGLIPPTYTLNFKKAYVEQQRAAWFENTEYGKEIKAKIDFFKQKIDAYKDSRPQPLKPPPKTMPHINFPAEERPTPEQLRGVATKKGCFWPRLSVTIGRGVAAKKSVSLGVLSPRAYDGDQYTAQLHAALIRDVAKVYACMIGLNASVGMLSFSSKFIAEQFKWFMDPANPYAQDIRTKKLDPLKPLKDKADNEAGLGLLPALTLEQALRTRSVTKPSHYFPEPLGDDEDELLGAAELDEDVEPAAAAAPAASVIFSKTAELDFEFEDEDELMKHFLGDDQPPPPSAPPPAKRAR